MYADSDVKSYFNTLGSLDLRNTGNGRWIDQKCTPDVLSIICDCIVDYFESTHKVEFTSYDIWHSDYAKVNVFNVFRKPDVNSAKAKSEYNKFFMQPMEALSYARVLSKSKNKQCNVYKIENLDILKYCALREKNSLFFLCEYITKVLKDSNIYHHFSYFFMHQDSDSFFKLKDAYTNFIISNTKINGKTETWRIFTKVLNPLAYMHNSCGSVRGLISKDVITFDILMYNRQNFRDLWCSKPKSLTRKEYAASHAKSAIDSSRTTALRSYLVNKAKKYVKQYNIDYNGGLPEISKYSDGTPGNHAHHIFPAELYPSISYYVENLICLSPNQHLYHAHPNNDTHRIDNDYQVLLLVAKSETIEKDYLNNRGFYDFDKFIFVLQTGYKDASFGSIHSLDFDSLRASIMRYYSTGC